MVKTKFSIALHIMTLLSIYKDEWLTSAWIAASLNMNPVLVRKEIAILKENGLIDSKEGKNGGVRILKDAKNIKLSDIFNSVKGEDNVLSLLKNTPNPDCIVGKQINQNLKSLLNTIDKAVSDALEKQTLENFKNQF
ncbi:Rrf2 family transcriptional regulator [Aquimarina sp. D1M17]|uniref:Rrf2 family transcriptional regulator n=1 Tax=Aquimarina acroporae TaxID=2937283 RepID=UPI0020BDE60F|nr:Rrf2 family transcriptional regulator [Aquimarina acroporae]MCK8522410.1 Rrf2 family transcriptional regulator [Aquimarina acroporae]